MAAGMKNLKSPDRILNELISIFENAIANSADARAFLDGWFPQQIRQKALREAHGIQNNIRDNEIIGVATRLISFTIAILDIANRRSNAMLMGDDVEVAKQEKVLNAAIGARDAAFRLLEPFARARAAGEPMPPLENQNGVVNEILQVFRMEFMNRLMNGGRRRKATRRTKRKTRHSRKH